MQTSALPLGYGAGGNVNSQFTMRSARVGVRTVRALGRGPALALLAGLARTPASSASLLHEPLTHIHVHYPDIHDRHAHA